jgi:hypothetical protein
LVLAVIAGGMVVVKYNYRNRVVTQPTIVTPTVATPTIVLTPTEAVDPDYPLWKILPYSGKGFVVVKYLAPMKLEVKTKGLDKMLVAKEVYNWLDSLGTIGKGHKISIIDSN